jgi:energy-coupling factor transporter ATP-binding protein EcfA2
MHPRTVQQCKDELDHIGSVAFAKSFAGHDMDMAALENMQVHTTGIVHDAIRYTIQAKSEHKKITEILPASKAVALIDLTEKYNLPGYTADRIHREVTALLAEMEVARAVQAKDPERISTKWQEYQATIADHDSQGQVNGIFRADEMRDSILNLYHTGLKPGLSTGWYEVDSLYSVRPCEMTIVTGIPGSGKSTWLDALAVNLYNNHEWRTAFCSPENWPISRHAAGLIEKVIGKPFNRDTPTAQRMNSDEVEHGLNIVSDAFYFTQLQEENMNIQHILEVMQGVIEKHGVNGIVLDPWNELEHRRPTDKSETEFISESLGQIRRFARFNKVHIWVVAHPTKLKRKDDGTYPVPRLYDIAGSAAFYNKADNGICVHRKDPRKPEVSVYVQKIRFKEIGKIGKAQLGFVADNGTYFDIPKNENN